MGWALTVGKEGADTVEERGCSYINLVAQNQDDFEIRLITGLQIINRTFGEMLRDDSEANWYRQAGRQTDGQNHVLSQADTLTKKFSFILPELPDDIVRNIYISNNTKRYWPI